MKFSSLQIAIRLLPAVFVFLGGCSGGDHKDLVKYMQEVHKRPARPIEPAPSFEEYRSFAYSPAGSRSPFEPPVEIVWEGSLGMDGRSDVKPDLTRPREFLENFSIGAITMMGTIEKNGELWALVNDGTGNVHRVRRGNYLGRNHGKILGIDKLQVTLVEIISDGSSGYLERPKILRLAEAGQ